MTNNNIFVIGTITKEYTQKSIKKRLEALLLDNVGKIVTNEMLVEVSKDPNTGKYPENWHQRLSELRTDDGYTILAQRDIASLAVGEYVLESTNKREAAGKRVLPTKSTWDIVLQRSNFCCAWSDSDEPCNLKDGSTDHIGGGTVKLTPDHMQPHSINPNADPEDPNQWQALCGRHQVMKKNYWDTSSGKINTQAIIQAASRKEKEIAYAQLKKFFGDD